MAEQLTVYEVGERFVTVDGQGYARVYEVGADGSAYVTGFMPTAIGGE